MVHACYYRLLRKICVFFKKLILLYALLTPPVDGCIRAGSLRRRTLKPQPPLIFKEHVPNVPEFSSDASGEREVPIVHNSLKFKNLVYNDNKDIIFKDEELRTKGFHGVKREDHYMTIRCKEKLDYLSMLVQNTWANPAVKLRVLEAWDQEGKHAHDSLHYEGRALDITTSDKDRSKYGLLARRAVQAGFDWVLYESRGHVHVSCKSDSFAGQKRAFRCFSGTSNTLLEGGKQKNMKDVQLGDKVLVLCSDGVFRYSPVIVFLDKQPEMNETFVKIRLDDNATSVTLSPDHLIYRLNRRKLKEGLIISKQWYSCVTPVFAAKLNIGDTILTAHRQRIVLRKVASVSGVLSEGAYAPLTAEGTIVVNDVVSSCYAATPHERLAHAALWPVRLSYVANSPGVNTIHTDSTRYSHGIHSYPKLLLKAAWFFEQIFSLKILL